MQHALTSVGEVAAVVDAMPGERIVVGVSGFGGAGKTTLATGLVRLLPSAVRLRGDDFIDPARASRRSTDWDGVLRERIHDEAIVPFRAGVAVRYRPIDWTTQALGEPVELAEAGVLVVDGIGLFHPTLLDAFDLTLWVDADLDVAMRRGIERDRARGWADAAEWEQVWTPNDADFARAFDPASRADVRYIGSRRSDDDVADLAAE